MAQEERMPAHQAIFVHMERIKRDPITGPERALKIVTLLDLLDDMTIPENAAYYVADRLGQLQKHVEPSLYNRINKSLAALRLMGN